MNDETAVQEGTQVQVQEEAQETVVVGKKKQQTDLIAEVAAEVENLTKVKAIHEATRLADNIEANYFKLGGVLKVIHQNTWFEGYETFGMFVYEKFGFQERKAKYLMEIYTELVTKQIPWETVKHLGWTKLKDLARVLTPENVDEWVAKAEKVTVLELQALLKASLAGDGSVPTATITDGLTTLKFKLKADQLETVQAGLNKAKAEVGTEYDTVALEAVLAGYLGGTVSASSVGGGDLKSQMKEAGWEKVLELFGDLFPDINLTVEV